jgi:hypothetical protein
MILAIEAAKSEKNQETRKAGKLATKGLQVGRPLLWAPLLRRAKDCPPYLLVRDRGAGWAGKMDDFEPLETDFATPFFEISGRIIERVTEFDQHV